MKVGRSQQLISIERWKRSVEMRAGVGGHEYPAPPSPIQQ